MVFGNILAQATCWALTLSSRLDGQAGCQCTLDSGKIPSALTNQGIFTGFQDASGSSVFLGIPYAASTAGNNRYVVVKTPVGGK